MASSGVDGLNLTIADGEFMVLVGPSGCGKSTALRSIAGLEDITSGTISIGSRVVNDLPPKDRDIAMVFQNYALYPHMTVEQNLAFGLQQRKTQKDDWSSARVTDVAKMLGLEDYLKRKPAALSGGQRQRVAMGRAIVREPQAFLMDEPLSNLDAKLRVSMRASLSQLHDRLGVTTVYVTHDQVEAMTLGQRVCTMLRDGKASASRHASDAVQLASEPLRGRLHRLTSDELRRCPARPRRRSSRCLQPTTSSRCTDKLLQSRRGLDGYFGKEVILGVRPSDFEDAQLAEPSWARMPVHTSVTEELGSEIHVIFTIDAAPVQHASITEARADDGDDEAIPLTDNKTLWTARVAARSSIKPGTAATLAVDTSNLQFFDPASGLSIGHPAN